MKFLFLFFILISCDRFTTWKTSKGGDFELRTPDGMLRTKDLRGRTLLVFFGFLNCPHVCPTTIRELNRMMKGMTPEEKAKVTPIFISVDPERDTPSVLKSHFKELDPGFIAATGTDVELVTALSLFGGSYRVIKGKTPDDVFIDHTSSVFVINRKGVWVNSLPFDASASEFRRAIDLSHSQKPFWSEEARNERIEVLGANNDCDLAREICEFRTTMGNFQVELSPRPVKHLEKIRVTVRSKNPKVTPKLADLVGLELSMGLIRPRLVKTSDNTWVAGFTLPTCELKTMNWKLRILLQDARRENFEISYRFRSIN